MKTIRKSRIEQYHASVNSVKLSPGLDFFISLRGVLRNDTGSNYLCGVKLKQI